MYSYIIVDDEALIRQGLRKKIESTATELVFAGEADNGEDALELIERLHPQLIFTDMRMPVMDGKSLLRILHRDYPEKKIIVVSGYSDFEYMQEAISAKVVHYLLKPFSREEIRVAAEKAILAIDLEQSAKHNALADRLEKQRISLQNDQQSALNILLGIESSSLASAFRSPDFRILSSGYAVLLLYGSAGLPAPPELPSDDASICLLHPQSHSLAYILLPLGEENDLISAESFAADYMRMLRRSGGVQIYMGMSSRKTDLNLLGEAGTEASRALDCRQLQDDEALHCFRNIWQPDSIPMWDKLPDLLFFIESGNTARTIELTLAFFVHLRSLPSISMAGFKAQCRHVIGEVKRLIGIYYPFEDSRDSSSSLENVLRTSFSDEEIQEYFLTVLSSSSDLMRENTDYSSNNVIENVKTYLSKNYRSAITLERISELFFINPSYLSHLFKEKTGVNLIDYLNGIRLEAAGRLLVQSDDKIYKIAKSTGFPNPKYFFRLFKKVKGMTPEEYRKKYRGNSEKTIQDGGNVLQNDYIS
ncbi:response regulator transcription factor [Saccharibacillus kuerlensis]|uniref:Stage 0 sporulation protein A homolog n=1 Tax=Saccharibacillus kuerlensis TaxID=459527 RepID=A0ABQ2L6J7_9BACL|nr:response regulator [Saccharibacillus kuerlensis]GGO01746.1 hypothetical protein GCM10010969_24400 [Saccharibacillus kuerlensis]